MDVSRNASSLEPAFSQNADQRWDPGPDLKSPGHWKRGTSIFVYTWRHHCIQITIVISALLFLLVGVLKWDVLQPPIHFQNGSWVVAEIAQNIIRVLSSPNHFPNAPVVSPGSPSNWGEWWIRIESFLGIGTLFVALFVWYGEIRENWENDLPKRMSVFFFYNDLPVIVCRYVWLAGADDLRAWGQQVAAQAAFNERSLEFSPEIKTQDPSLVIEEDGNMICKHYIVSFQLKRMPSLLANYSLAKDSEICPYGRDTKASKCKDRRSLLICRYQNFAGKDKSVHSVPSSKVEALDCCLTLAK
jgi:hypothetical protein